MDFGKSFKFYRQKAHLTQKEAAEKIGVKDYQLANYETNRSQPSLEILKKMSKVYLVSIDKMLGNSVLPNKNDVNLNNDGYEDIDELISILNEVVDRIKKASKQ